MRILILTQYYPPEIGAPQTRLAALARELRRRGFGVEVVTAMPHHLVGRVYKGYRGKLYLRESIEGVRVHRTWVYAATGTGVRRMLNYFSFALTSLFALLFVRRCDVVFVESPPLFLSVPGWIAAMLHRATLIFNVADLWPDSVRELGVLSGGPLLALASHLEAWTYRRADYVNAVTEGIERILRNDKGVPARKLRFLPNGIDTERFTPRRAHPGLRARLRLDERNVFIYAGTHGIAQGLHTLVHAAELVGQDATLLFVGSGPIKPYLVQLTRERGLQNVRFCDPVPLDDMPDYFALAYASIVPLVRGDLMRGARPSKLFPAFACGVPVIYSGEGEGADLVTQADAGVAVPPEDAPALAAAMRELLADPQARERMAQAARKLARERFTWSTIVDRWLSEVV
jgi:colanic acid biosynthesis glycosyl transferase WcaI